MKVILTAFQNLNIPRKTNENRQLVLNIENDEKLMKTFWKNVKLKKRHEIPIMAKLCYEMAVKCNCFYIVDVGSGLGHLSRMLSYGYNLEICTIEADNELVKQARILDERFDPIFQKKYEYRRPIRQVNMRIDPNITSEDFLSIVCSAFSVQEDNFEFGIVGLHPCGDLGPTLLRLYQKISSIKFINVVGCCYMKLSTPELCSSNPGFPLSKFCIDNKNDLSYHSREIACHAIENYIVKLHEGEFWKLKIHAYRATIEKILTEMDTQYKHIPLAGVKYVKDLDFENYCKRATYKLLGHNAIDPMKYNSKEVKECLEQWKSVVIFYSFRLFFAPLIESLILYDRLLFLQEKGNHVDVIAGFESRISPRMHILQGQKIIEK
ncbi:hypothetical protein WA026_004748 [Henosepilachna vigintioctopunctata]|uniref:Methyltransferase domain-containing protein n=1 Tax=Henosepilachna vigintioctopunctata TaxID=420089 RepID=A0AAW1VAX8_9CUCU